ncbi:MAG: carboxypeptidase-like regulatory domain-containing protein, partial [Bacteroidales bacterium]|nr:carboxypeptidase-like regulatory domain-containing protein [Bacteroidales bacterium]
MLKRLLIHIFFIILIIYNGSDAYSQKITRIKGKVIDAQTKEPMPFVNIVFLDKNIGTITDYKGKYTIETQWASNKLEASFIGYEKQVKAVITEKSQVIDFQLEMNTILLDEAVVVSNRERYRNKNNIAVELIRKVIENKNLNRKEFLDYYQYNKYEKIEFDINNITESFKKKKVFKKFQFIFNYIDTAEINGKPYLPIFLKETTSNVYYRKKPKSEKEHITGVKMIGFHDYIDNDGVGFMIDNMYQDIDIYNNDITLLTNQFVSPISNIAPAIYKFHIIDTVDVNGYSCINLVFQPRNKQDFAFKGNLYITNDDRYAVIKVDMRVTEDVNLNFVNDLQVIQEFSYINDQN